MIHIKTLKYTNTAGISIEANTGKRLYCSNMDLSGVNGIFATENYAFSHGQVTVSRNIGARTIPCQFIFNDRCNDEAFRNKLCAVFSPLLTGTLTIETGSRLHGSTYEIDVYPAAVPVFRRDTVNYLWKFEVDFIADYPFFRKKKQQIITLTDAYTIIKSDSPIDVPLEITFPESAVFTNYATGAGFTLHQHPDNKAVTVNTKDFSVIDEDGNDVNHLIGMSDDISRVGLVYGDNNIFCACGSPVVMKWYDLVLGVF